MWYCFYSLLGSWDVYVELRNVEKRTIFPPGSRFSLNNSFVQLNIKRKLQVMLLFNDSRNLSYASNSKKLQQNLQTLNSQPLILSAQKSVMVEQVSSCMNIAGICKLIVLIRSYLTYL